LDDVMALCPLSLSGKCNVVFEKETNI